MPRRYEVRPKAVVTISDEGEVSIDIDLINVPFEMENDYLAGHKTEEVAADLDIVRSAFMESPLNHYAHVALQRQ